MAATLYRMYGEVEFDREINTDVHYISPGGYEAKFSDGRTMQFDFEDYEGGRVRGESNYVWPRRFEWVQKNPDRDAFEDIDNFTYEDFVEKFEGFEDFYIYTGETDDAEINPVKAISIELEFYDKEKDEFFTFEVPEDKLPNFDIDKELDR